MAPRIPRGAGRRRRGSARDPPLEEMLALRVTVRALVTTAIAAAVLLLGGCAGGGAGSAPVVFAVTTSTQDTGLLDALIPAFEEDTGISARSVAVGSGQALAMARRGEVDVVLAHSPAAERRLMESGVAGRRRPVMHNRFVLVGPVRDPAGIRGMRLVPALREIGERAAPFVSRGDDSGTHVFERSAWRRAGVEPAARWYQETGQGQSATLQVAAERGAYAITDDATYLTAGVARALPVVVDEGKGLTNPYHVIELTDEAGGRVNAEGGRELADWLVSSRAQRIIADYGRAEHGRSLFEPARADVG